MKRWGLALVAAGLGLLPATAAASTRIAYGGGSVRFEKKLFTKSSEALSFFPSVITVHVGDSISWKGLKTGFHTVDFPGSARTPLPLIAPVGTSVTGVLDAAGNPLWFDGKVPEVGFNPALFGRTGPRAYNGTARVDSGLPFGPLRPFVVKFTKVGHYAYFCDVHAGMHGLVIVVPRRRRADTRAQIAARIAAQETAALAEAKRLSRRRLHGDVVSLGLRGRHHVEALRMFQGVTHIKAGTTITFVMPRGSGEVHTATFGPQPYLNLLALGFDRPVIDPRSIFRSSPPGMPLVLDQMAHGNGFANTGALSRDKHSRLPFIDRITFTQPGVYRFQCLIHPFMRGVVIVH